MQLDKIAPHKWRPGRQPKGKIRVNWSHPLSRGLRFAYIPSVGYFDLVTGWKFNIFGTVYAVADSAGIVDYQSGNVGNGWNLVGASSSSAIAKQYDTPAITAFTLVKNRSDASNSTEGAFKRPEGSGTPDWCVGLYKGTFNGLQATIGNFTDSPASSVFDTTLKFYACAITGDGANAVSYIDGVVSKSGAYTPGTYAYDNYSKGPTGGFPVNYQAGTMTNMALALLWDHALSAAEVAQISRDPYCIFETVPPQRIGVTVGGGTAYSESLALGLQMATADNAGLAATGAVSMGLAAGVLEAGNMAAVSALALGLQAGLSDSSTNALASSNLALGLGLVITSASFNQTSGALNLGLFVGAGLNGGQDFTVNIPLGLIAGLQINGGKSHSDSVGLGLVLGQAVAAAIIAYLAPTTRILGVQTESRTLEIKIENRCLMIAVENRTINIKLE